MGFLSSLFGNGEQTEAAKFETLRDDGVRAMQMGELPYAEKCFLAALDIERDTKTLSFLAETYLCMRNSEKACPLLSELHAKEPDNVEVALLLAQTQGELKLFADQRTTCEEILAAHADEARALFLDAEALHGLGDDIMAIARLTQSLVLEPEYHRALKLRAEILGHMGQWTSALDDIEALVAADADNEEYLLLRAEAHTALSNSDKAIADYQRVLENNPFSREAVLRLGKLYEETTRWDKALALYDEAIDLQPQFAEAYKARGGVRHHLKDEAGAADDLKRSLELAPEQAKALDGEYTNLENRMKDMYRQNNPYQF